MMIAFGKMKPRSNINPRSEQSEDEYYHSEVDQNKKVTSMGFEPTPVKTTALT